MAEETGISWADSTFNPWIGCTKVAPECSHCYAERDFDTRRHVAAWGPNGSRVVTSAENWRKPVRWDKESWQRKEWCIENGQESAYRRPRVFCASLSDVFESWDGPIMSSGANPVIMGNDFRASRGSNRLTLQDVRERLFALIDATLNLDWLILTKRPENIGDMWAGGDTFRPNVMLGTSAGCQETAEKMIPELIKHKSKCAGLFLSAEPMLGPVILLDEWLANLDWVIGGGESGQNARPMNVQWARYLRDRCERASVPFHWKQFGEWLPRTQIHDGVEENKVYRTCSQPYPGEFGDSLLVGKKVAGRLLDGVLHDAVPDIAALASRAQGEIK